MIMSQVITFENVPYIRIHLIPPNIPLDLLVPLKFIGKQIKDCEKEIKSLMTVINSPIATIPGIGDILSSIILNKWQYYTF